MDNHVRLIEFQAVVPSPKFNETNMILLGGAIVIVLVFLGNAKWRRYKQRRDGNEI